MLRVLCVLLLYGHLHAQSLSAADSSATPAARTATAQDTAPELIATYSASSGRSTTLLRCAALHVPAEHSPAPGLATGPFTVLIEGFLNLELRTKLTFSASGNGKVRVHLRDQLVFEGEGNDLSSVHSEPFRIRKGLNALRVEYTSPQQGDATLRLYWQGDDFVREPLPTEALFHSADARSNVVHQTELGRRLFSTQRCTSCHLADHPLHTGHASFSLGAAAPSFARIGERLNPEWIARWMLDPQAMRPTTRMPRMLPGGLADAESRALARSVAADLVQDAPQFDASAHPPASAASVQLGATLVTDLGCATCHVLPGSRAEADDTRTSLTRVAEKFRPGALARFIADPAADFPTTRMPRFTFAAGEAEAIEAWLRSVAPAPLPPLSTEPLPRAYGVIVKFRCTQCHDPREDTARPAAPLADINAKDWSAAGCASEKAAPGMAQFTFTAEERNALEQFRQSGVHSAFQTSASEQSRAAVTELQCNACHVRDGRVDTWTQRISPVEVPNATTEAEKLSQTRPELTWVGEKLHQGWMQRVFEGDAATRIRPWLRARMPAFPAHATLLARGLGAEHGFPETKPECIKTDDETLTNGRFLASREGFGCTACHWLGSAAPYATFEFGATDLALAWPRLRSEWVLRWMWKPQRVVRGSRMPIYASPAEPQTAQDSIWDGDAQRQFAAMWAWMSSL